MQSCNKYFYSGDWPDTSPVLYTERVQIINARPQVEIDMADGIKSCD